MWQEIKLLMKSGLKSEGDTAAKLATFYEGANIKILFLFFIVSN
jgi:hypothetical protein